MKPMLITSEIKPLDKYARYRIKDLEGYRKRKREWARTESQRKIRREYMRMWRNKNRERHNELARQSHHRNKHKHIKSSANRALLYSIGITLNQKECMIAEQQGLCKICARQFPNSSQTHVDHCHVTGKVRGILCGSCNTRLGWHEKYKEKIESYLAD